MRVFYDRLFGFDRRTVGLGGCRKPDGGGHSIPVPVLQVGPGVVRRFSDSERHQKAN